MIFDRFDFMVVADDVYIFPTIRISSQREMIDSNFNIQFHFAVFHFRWRWIHMKRAKRVDCKARTSAKKLDGNLR